MFIYFNVCQKRVNLNSQKEWYGIQTAKNLDIFKNSLLLYITTKKKGRNQQEKKK